MRTFTIITLLFVTIILLGCSRTVPLSGRITFADTGEPLTQGAIGFTNGTIQSRSDIGADGRYTLSFRQQGDGLPRGEYRIFIRAVESGTTTDKEGRVTDYWIKPLIAKKYESPDTSELTFYADGKTSTFDIKVERAEKP